MSKLSDALHRGDLTRPQELLLCIASLGDGVHAVAALRTVARSNGIADTNIARAMKQLKGMAFHGKAGWTLTGPGKVEAAKLLGAPAPSPQVSSLHDLLLKLKEPVKDFVAEAVGCFEEKRYRAAVVLSWVGAVSLLYDHLIQHRLADFNAEALRRDAKWKAAKTADGLARMKEHDFLQVIESLSIIDKNQKTELEGCLKLRNGCGHPNNLRIAEHRCASHVEVLILNVFEKFS
jgi:hypothetical protein